MDVTKPTISNRRLVLALICAAVTAWFCTVALLFLDVPFEQTLDQVLAGVVLFAIFGLPPALLVTFIVGMPIALAVRENGWTRPTHAALFGLGGGFAIWAGWLGYRLIEATGGNDGYLWNDGWPTALGWQQELASAPVTAAIGLVSALVAWRVATPRAAAMKRRRSETE